MLIDPEPPPEPQGWLRRDDRTTLLMCTAMVLAFIAGVTFILKTPAPAKSRIVLAKAVDDDLTTGSILFMPDHGDRCYNRLIDNATWRIYDNGEVDCREALARSRNARGSGSRVDAIRQGFTKR